MTYVSTVLEDMIGFMDVIVVRWIDKYRKFCRECEHEREREFYLFKLTFIHATRTLREREIVLFNLINFNTDIDGERDHERGCMHVILGVWLTTCLYMYIFLIPLHYTSVVQQVQLISILIYMYQ